MRDGRFFHAVWLCSVCILPAGRRMWDTLFLHGEAFRALAAATDGSAKRRRAVAQTEGPGLVPSLLYSTIWRQVRYVRICWCGVVSLRGDPPSRTASFPYVCGYVVRQGYRDAVTVPLSEMWGGRQPGSRQVRESLPKLAGGVPAGQGNRKRKRGGPWQALPLFLVYGRALTGPERLPAGWARRVRGPRAGSARRAPPARVRQAARFPQARACLPRERGPQPPRPGQPAFPQERRHQSRERWLPAFPEPGRLQPEQRPQGPGPLQELPHQQRAFPVRPFRQQLRGPQEPRFPQQRPERQGQRRSGAGRRRA